MKNFLQIAYGLSAFITGCAVLTNSLPDTISFMLIPLTEVDVYLKRPIFSTNHKRHAVHNTNQDSNKNSVTL